MEQGIWDSIVQILAGILFLTPLKAMFKRVMTSMKNNDSEGLLEYHFPKLYNFFKRKD